MSTVPTAMKTRSRIVGAFMLTPMPSASRMTSQGTYTIVLVVSNLGGTASRSKVVTVTP